MARHRIICLSCVHRSLKLLNDSIFVPPAAIYSLFHGFSLLCIRPSHLRCRWINDMEFVQNNLREPDMQIDCYRCTLKTFFNNNRHIEHIRGVIFATMRYINVYKYTFTLYKLTFKPTFTFTLLTGSLGLSFNKYCTGPLDDGRSAPHLRHPSSATNLTDCL